MQKKDYLKHLRLVRRYYMLKYKLKLADLEMLLFLYSENRFPKKIFNDYQQTMTWEKGRLDRYIREGWVSVFREKTKGKKAIYQMTARTKTIITQLYKLLEGREILRTLSITPCSERMPPTETRPSKEWQPVGTKLYDYNDIPFGNDDVRLLFNHHHVAP